MDPIDFGGQRSKVKVTIHIVNHGERMNSIDFGGHMSKVKVTMDIWWLTNVGCAGMLRFALLYLLIHMIKQNYLRDL